MIALPTKSFYGLLALALALFVNHSSLHAAAAESPPDGFRRVVQTVPGMPPVINPDNLYSETARDKLSATVVNHLSRIYVPNRSSNDVWVIDGPHGEVLLPVIDDVVLSVDWDAATAMVQLLPGLLAEEGADS